ncbi:hypothetical protein [Bacillus pinisoli]|uniref:hypothetical protein n=1 Tax=Bacillus pinisoli TaxID=2901866 RepID=UPI001FF62DA9|nr:hypothetical protein [Bacillus pinisoli]
MLVGWNEWELPRLLTLLFGIFYMLLWMQVTIWHARGKFHKWQMWIPVITLPLLGLTAILLSIWPTIWWGWMQTILSTVGIVAGIYGGALHLTAIRHRTGGFKMENFMSGPPFILPFSIAAFGLFSLLLVWY